MAAVLDWSPKITRKMRVRTFCYWGCLSIALLLTAEESGERAYRNEVQKWRDEYTASLKEENGWVALAGLFWLKEGANPFGAASTSSIVLPPGSAPGSAGCFIFHQGNTQLLVNSGAPVLLNGKPVPSPASLKPDSSGEPDRITLGHLSMIVIQRGVRYGIRLWDNRSPARLNFAGTRWFPVKESYRVTAQFTSYPQPRMIPIRNILGDTEPTPSPGFAALGGKQCRLEPVVERDQLCFMFKDATSGHATYPAGRFLYTALPVDGEVILDFNHAHNPPCAFTPYATCPLPPKQNHLSVAVEAGELNSRHAAN